MESMHLAQNNMPIHRTTEYIVTIDKMFSKIKFCFGEVEFLNSWVKSTKRGIS